MARYGLIDRDGWGVGHKSNETTVFAVYNDEKEAYAGMKKKGSNRYMVIAAAPGGSLSEGQTIYLDCIRRLYPVVF